MTEIEGKVDAKALSDNTANIGLVNVGDMTLNFSGKGIANAIGAFSIALNPGKLADMREANADGIIRAANKYIDGLGMTREQAILMALGTPSTPGQAENFLEVFENASRILEARGVELHEPEPSKAAKMLEGAKNSEEWARDKWAKLIAGELESPGSFSKQAMVTLDEMERSDALLFEKLCSLCIGGEGAGGSVTDIIPWLVGDAGGFSFDGGAISRAEVVELKALGIVAVEGRVSSEVGEAVTIYIAGEPMHILRTPEAGKALTVGEMALTRQGRELAALCLCGTAPGFRELVKREVEKQGFKVASPVELAEALMAAMTRSEA